MLKIGYFADGPWAHEALCKILADGSISVVFICVRYDKQDPILQQYASEHHIQIFSHKNINSSEFIQMASRYRADLFVTMSFNQIFKKDIMELPALGVINCHAGKLPFYRGRNILNWALINDEKEFGITVHYIDEGIDTGDIILQTTFPITDADTYATLLLRAYLGCAQILYDAIKKIQAGDIETIPQRSIDPIGTYFGMRQLGDEIVDWNQTSREIFNFVRAICLPGPQAVSFIKGEKILINKVNLIEGAHIYKNTVGQVVGKSDSGFCVKTYDTMVEVTDYVYAGRIKMGDRLEKQP